jgi:hypothetical protein
MEDTVKRLQQAMDLSSTLGAPVEGIPDKAVDVIRLILPYLTEHTTPREAAIVVASAYLYFASILTRECDGDGKRAMAQAKDLLDAAHCIMSGIMIDDSDDA